MILKIQMGLASNKATQDISPILPSPCSFIFALKRRPKCVDVLNGNLLNYSSIQLTHNLADLQKAYFSIYFRGKNN